MVDAGENRNICPQEILEGPRLEGSILSGDVERVYWETEYSYVFQDKEYFYYASSMLSDTTILDPIIEQHFESTVRYYLYGITKNEEICVDSVEMNFSDWIALTIDKITGKPADDTIQLWIAISSNWPHIRYEWSPNYMISDTTVESPYVWNDTTTFYRLVITDSLGCSVEDDIFEVYITSSLDNVAETEKVQIYPNPVENILNIEYNEPIERVEIYDLNGHRYGVFHDNTIDVSHLHTGKYILRISFRNDRKSTIVFQKVGL